MTINQTNMLNQPHADRSPSVILVEDHDDLRTEVAFQLRYHHIIVREVSDGHGLERELTRQAPDIILLDINLPDRSGFELAIEVRRCYPSIGIIMLTARSDVDDRILGFDTGADIYLVKPIDFRELHACIKSLFIRLNRVDSASQWFFSKSSRILRSPSQLELVLTTLEAMTFTSLLVNRGAVCGRESLHNTLGFNGLDLNDIRLNTLMSRLRRRLAEFDPELRIVTWRNKGYAYVGPPIQTG